MKENFNDLLPGQYLWFSKEGTVGQVRVIDVDKKNNKLMYHYNDGTDHNIEIDFDYSKNSNGVFYSDIQGAIDNSNYFNSIYNKIQNPGSYNARVVSKSPEEIEASKRKSMILD